MPKARVKMNKIRVIIRLHSEDCSERMISRATGVSRPVVGQYIRQAKSAGLDPEDVDSMDDDELIERLSGSEKRRHDGRYADLLEKLPGILNELGKRKGKNHLTRQILWEEYRSESPDGYVYSQFCYHLQVFSETSEIAMHLHHEPGEKLFIDYAGDRPDITDPKSGRKTPVELFVTVFPAGGLIYIEATRSQNTEDTIRATRHSLEHAGGAPKIIDPDNLKAVVSKPDWYEPQLNRAFEAFGSYYGCAILPARVRKPKDKALVEAAVNLTYTQCLSRLRNRDFATLEELNTALWEQMDLMNARLMQKVKISRRERFDSLEADRLRPLPAEPYITRHYAQPITVQKNYHVYFPMDKHYYSVPSNYRGLKVTIAFTNKEIEIYSKNRRIAVHRRDEGLNQYTTNTDHMPSEHQYQSGLSVEKFIRWAGEIGPETQSTVAAVLSSREVPQQAFRSCQGILSLGKRYNPVRLESACRMANGVGVPNYKSLKRILDHGLEVVSKDSAPTEQILPFHENIRGDQAFASGKEAL